MQDTVFKTLFWLIVGVLLQVLVFSRLHVLGAVVLIYLIALMKVPLRWPHVAQIVIGFVCGLAVDVFSNTPGMHAFTACTFMALRRPLVVSYFFDNDQDVKEGMFTVNMLDPVKYSGYAAISIVSYSALLYLVESFSLFNLVMLLSKVGLGAAMTMAFELVTGLMAYQSYRR